jgi:preprotein translocase subunit SecF
MKVKYSLFLLALALFFAINLYSQNPKKQQVISESLKSDPISKQFNTLIDMSPDFQGFKNIRHTNLNRFKRNFNDSLQANLVRVTKMMKIITTQKQEISNLEKEILALNEKIDDLSKNKDTINFFGTRITKNTYNTILWSIIFGLLVGLLFFMFRFKNSNSITKEAKRALSEIEEEFDTHRKKALEREQVLRRQLQDEINKQRSV